MNVFGFARRRSSAPVARERLQILLEYERSAVNPKDLIAVLREQILVLVARHVAIDPEKVQVTVECGAAVSTLAVDIEIPNAGLAAGQRAPGANVARGGQRIG
jgi:cell division topological specificity factor